MAKWMRVDHKFEDHAALFYINERTLRRVYGLDTQGLYNEQPENIERIVYDMIDDERSDLVGGVIISIDYNVQKRQVEILYLHRSLPKVGTGCLPERQPLLPQYDGENPTSNSITLDNVQTDASGHQTATDNQGRAWIRFEMEDPVREAIAESIEQLRRRMDENRGRPSLEVQEYPEDDEVEGDTEAEVEDAPPYSGDPRPGGGSRYTTTVPPMSIQANNEGSMGTYEFPQPMRQHGIPNAHIPVNPETGLCDAEDIERALRQSTTQPTGHLRPNVQPETTLQDILRAREAFEEIRRRNSNISNATTLPMSEWMGERPNADGMRQYAEHVVESGIPIVDGRLQPRTIQELQDAITHGIEVTLDEGIRQRWESYLNGSLNPQRPNEVTNTAQNATDTAEQEV